MAAYTDEDENFFKIFKLVTGVGTDAIRVEFDKLYPPGSLKCKLDEQKPQLEMLRKFNRIYNTQWVVLFPPTEQTVSSGDFDITLMICLIRNISTIQKPINGFDKLPPTRETTPAADIARIKYYRNMMAHSVNDKITQCDFIEFWTQLTEAICRLGGITLQAKCDAIKEMKIISSVDFENIKCQIKLLKEEFKQDIDRLADEIEQLKTDQTRVPDWMMSKLQDWKKEDDNFVETTASHNVMDCLRNNKCVSVVGPPGIGKTSLVQHVALKMQNIGLNVISVNSPDDIKNNYHLNKEVLFVVDDMCGNFTANTERLYEWRKGMKDIRDILNNDHNPCKLILTCRSQVFQDKGFNHSDLELFQTCVCNLVNEGLALSHSEKDVLARTYFKEIDLHEIECLYKYDFFPFLCKLYHVNKNKSNFSLKTFLKDPFDMYKRELDDLFVDCIEGKYKFSALLLLVVCNNHLEKNMLTGKEEKMKQIVETILDECDINDHLRGTSLISELDTLVESYLVIENGIYQTTHDKLFDFLACYYGTTNKVTNKVFTRLLIEHAEGNFVGERFVFKDPGQSDDTISEEYLIPLQDDVIPLYFERVFSDLTQSDYIDGYLDGNRNKKRESFRNGLSILLDQLPKQKISSLIQNASMDFVCSMFVINDRDIKTFSENTRYESEHYGIILSDCQLKKYIERMFVDLTKSDDVAFYMKRSRCCRNESFCTNLLTYMTSQGSTEITELIESTDTNFVQLMLVMEKGDIKPITPQIYKRFGIVVHDDFIPDYIKRVFGDMTRSNDVNKYLNSNRNCRNTKFHTKLLDHMTQLDRKTIEHLIKKASRSFIYHLCVMTMGDINEISYKECERYGVIIPDECIHSYADRWFDEMTKTGKLRKYFEKNRNGQSQKFKRSLQTYMADLPEEKIKMVIQTTNADILRNMFVTTKEDIKNDSSKEYEHYGIILPEQYLNMYTERILGFGNFLTTNKYNRTFNSVLKCIGKLGIAKMIDTADETSFHRMIKVDIEKESELENKYFDCQSPDAAFQIMLEMNDGFLTCPASLSIQYMDRMIIDWGQGKLYSVFNNTNLKNKFFSNKFLDYLNLLEPSKISELVNIEDKDMHSIFSTPLEISCHNLDVNLAKWCLEHLLSENPKQGQIILCALFLLVVFNNQLKETTLTDELIKITDDKFSFRKRLNIREDISAREVMEGINTSLNRFLLEKKDGIYEAIYGKVFSLFVLYFVSIGNMSNVLVEYADERLLCNWFLEDKSFYSGQHFSIPLAEEELLICIRRVFTKMTNSLEFTRNILNRDNKTIINAVTAYVKKLDKQEIITIFENACIDFINKFFAIAETETQDHGNEESIFHIVIPDNSTPIYLQRIFDYISNNDCVEACLQGNRNKTNAIFHTMLLTFMRNLNIDDVERLIAGASSDFMYRMLVISEDDIKPESCWEYERYGIVVPEELLKIYIERVISDMTKSVYVPVNRNSENKKFQEALNSYTNSFSETELEDLLKTASGKCIRRMFLSVDGKFVDLKPPQRCENYHLLIPENYYRLVSKTKSKDKLRSKTFHLDNVKECFTTTIMENDPCTFTMMTREGIKWDDAIITVRSKTSYGHLQQELTKQIDPMFTSKIMEIHVRFPEWLVSKYIQRMVDDWMKGNVHDVFANVNFGNPSFRHNFLTHLQNFEQSTQVKLTEMTDKKTGDSALAVSCYVGIVELVKWCLDNNADTNCYNKHEERPLFIACNQNRPDIVNSLLHSKNKVDVNQDSSKFWLCPLHEACKIGNGEIVSMLLKENANVNGQLDNSFHERPLHVACKYGHDHIVSLLLGHKVTLIEINKVDYKERTSLYVACKRGNTNCASLLLNHNADEIDLYKGNDNGHTPLYAASEGGYVKVVLLLLERDIKIMNKSGKDGASPLWVACLKGHVEVVSTLLNCNGIEIDKCMLIGISPLCIASIQGHTEIVQMLLEEKADAEICVKNKEIVMQIFKKYRNKYKRPQTLVYEQYIKYLRQIVSGSASKDVKTYIDGKEEDWVFNSILGSSPLHMCSLMGHTDIVKLIVKRISNINMLNQNGSTPLFLACELGNEDIVQELLTNGADLNLNRKDGKSPLTIAEDNGHVQIVEHIKSQTVYSSSIKQSK